MNKDELIELVKKFGDACEWYGWLSAEEDRPSRLEKADKEANMLFNDIKAAIEKLGGDDD